MIVLADEALENFFDHEFAQSFKLTEKVIEQQRSFGREIFDNLLATGTKLATNVVASSSVKSVSPLLLSPTSSHSDVKVSAESIVAAAREEESKVEEKKPVEKKTRYVLGDESDEESDKEEENTNHDDASLVQDSDDEDLSPDVLEEVDRLLKEYGDEDD
jgi:hypothetical protein